MSLGIIDMRWQQNQNEGAKRKQKQQNGERLEVEVLMSLNPLFVVSCLGVVLQNAST